MPRRRRFRRRHRYFRQPAARRVYGRVYVKKSNISLLPNGSRKFNETNRRKPLFAYYHRTTHLASNR
jgi:hypothetical protein